MNDVSNQDLALAVVYARLANKCEWCDEYTCFYIDDMCYDRKDVLRLFK